MLGLSLWGGNPSRSQAVNALICQAKVHEVCQTGIKLQAQWAFFLDEFLQLVKFMDGLTHSNEKRTQFCVFVTLQWQLLGRVYNMQKTQVCNFSYDYDVPQELIVRLQWSKTFAKRGQRWHRWLLVQWMGRSARSFTLVCFWR